MKALFNKYEAYTEAGNELSNEVICTISTIIKKWADKGYSIRDIEAIIIDSIFVESAAIRLQQAAKMIQDEK